MSPKARSSSSPIYRQSIGTASLRIATLGLCLCLGRSGMAQAAAGRSNPPVRANVSADTQEVTESLCWQRIRQRDAGYKSVRADWLLDMVEAPNGMVNPEKAAALSEAQDNLKSASADQSARNKQAVLQLDRMMADGCRLTEQQRYQVKGELLRCEVIYGAVISPGMPLLGPTLRAHVVDIYDGSNVITLSGVGPEMPTEGSLTRDKHEILSSSAPLFGEGIFLYGAPILHSFPPEKTRLRVTSPETCVLETQPENTIPRIALLTVSIRTGQPLSMEIVDARSRKTRSHYLAKDYKTFAGDISLPAYFSLIRTTEAGQITSSSQFRLASASGNARANIDLDRHIVPPGTLLNDYRFGLDSPAPRYKVHNALPSDDQVRALMAHTENNQGRAVSEERGQRIRAASLTGTGALILTLIVLPLWKRAFWSKTPNVLSATPPRKP